jgi:predicted transposase/invertase (TIGR01784 family)
VSIDSSINLRNDVIFRAIFGYEKNEKLLISLLNAILGLTGDKKIVSLTFLNAFNIKEYLKDKLTILDVKAVDGTGVRFDVEMQVAPDKSYLQRIMYYLDRLFTEQLKQGDPYEKLCKAISISILDFIFFEEEGDLHNIYRFLNVKSKRELTDLKELQFIELPKFKKDKPKRDMSKFEKWLLALKFGEIYASDLENLPEELKEEEEIVMALHELVRASNDDMIREILEMRSKARHDEASRLYQAKMEGKEDVAKNLLEMDMPIEKIAKATGISVEEIKKLK